ncbi:hypothetical protein ACFTXB_20285, partial [Streptomyces sp. NPDC057074]|uniref:hypothetical protein n=1 Tax=Streptomyces sp. NPDC057074 TaxID=3346015 RepID=UPI00364149B6
MMTGVDMTVTPNDTCLTDWTSGAGRGFTGRRRAGAGGTWGRAAEPRGSGRRFEVPVDVGDHRARLDGHTGQD